MNMRQTKAPTNQPTIPKDLSNLLRACIRYNIKILGFTPQQQIANATAN
jgi:hypothetical protein